MSRIKELIKDIKDVYPTPISKLFRELAVESAKSIPAIGGMVSATEKLCRGLAAIEQEERENRMKAYVTGVARDYNEDIEFREEDVLSVMHKLGADDEASKTEFYIRLTINLGRTGIDILPLSQRYHFIRMISELTHYQIHFARELQIRKTVPICGFVSFDEAELKLTQQDNGMILQAVSTLKNWGLITDIQERPRAKPIEYQLYSLKRDFKILIDLLFHREDLIPEAVGLSPKKNVDIIIASPYGSVDNFYEQYITNILNSKGFTVETESAKSNHLHEKIARVYLHTALLTDNYKEYIQVYVSKSGISSEEETLRKFKIEKEVYTRNRNNSSYLKANLREKLDLVIETVLTNLKKADAES